MNRTFVIQSTLLTGELKYTYNPDGLLIGFHVEAELSAESLTKILQNLPLTQSQFDFLVESRRKAGTLKSVIELKETYDFDRFYAAYPRKLAKADAQKAFQKLKDFEQIKATEQIKAYKKQCDKDKVSYLYPATYLNSRRWDDE